VVDLGVVVAGVREGSRGGAAAHVASSVVAAHTAALGAAAHVAVASGAAQVVITAVATHVTGAGETPMWLVLVLVLVLEELMSM
jgi:hypothetical protein